MFEVGFTELLLIFALALVVLGPEKLPRVASQVGRWLGRARSMARQLREQLEDEVNLETPVRRGPGPGAGRADPPPEPEIHRHTPMDENAAGHAGPASGVAETQAGAPGSTDERRT